jgi:hypothetical protein
VTWEANDTYPELPASYDDWKTNPPDDRPKCEECNDEGCRVCEEDPDREHDLRNDEPELFEPDDDYSAYEGQD